MKILLTTLYIAALALKILIAWGFVHPAIGYILFIASPLIFYMVTRDKANTLRVSLCSLTFLPETPMPLCILAALAAVLANDEWIRKVASWKLIVFTGMDGAGKSTHARLTAEWLRGKGINAIHFHIFKHPLVTSLSLGLAKVQGRSVIRSAPGNERVYTREFRERVWSSIAALRPWLTLLDNMLYIIPKLTVNMLRGRWVVADRYFYDYLVRLKVLGYPVPPLLEKLYKRLTPKPDLLIVFDVDPKVSYERRCGEHPLWYYEKARPEYLKLAEELGGHVINTEDEIDKVQERINKLIEEHLLAKKH